MLVGKSCKIQTFQGTGGERKRQKMKGITPYSGCSQLEYFMIQCLKQKAKERPEKRRGNKLNEPRPPHLEQPGEVL